MVIDDKGEEISAQRQGKDDKGENFDIGGEI